MSPQRDTLVARTRLMVVGIVIGACLATAAAAQPARAPRGRSSPPEGEPAMVEVAPLRCWWRTSAGAVRIGQRFDVRLTCAVLETASVQVVPDETRLAVAGVQLKPFEVLGGEHPADTRAGQRRFLQYRYTVRLLDPDAIGTDVSLPNLAITYKVQSRVAGDATLAGRDFTYVMPGLPVHVLSLVPEDGVDIRDGEDVGLERVEALRFRAGLYDIGALALAAAGGLLAILAIVAVVGRSRPAAGRERRPVSERRQLAAAAAELARIDQESAGGWTAELVASAHAAIRVVAAVALGRGLGEVPLAAGETPRDGRLAVRGWRPGRPGAAISSATTAADVDRALADLPPETPVQRRLGLERLQGALRAVTAARYAAPESPPDAAALSAALDAARIEAARLARERRWRLPWRSAAGGSTGGAARA